MVVVIRNRIMPVPGIFNFYMNLTIQDRENIDNIKKKLKFKLNLMDKFEHIDGTGIRWQKNGWLQLLPDIQLDRKSLS